MLLAVCLINTPAQAKYHGGSGTAGDPYRIAAVEDLMLLGNSPEDYSKHFILTGNIDLDPGLPGRKVFDKAVIAPDTGNPDWVFQGTPFTGVFDGNGQMISHLTIKGGEYLGLFGRLASGAEVRDLGVQTVSITASGNRIYIGGLVGSNGGTVIRCYSTGAVSGSQSVGGLVGINEWGHVIQCYSTAAVSGRGEGIGGLVGSNGDWRSGGVVTQSYSTGPVSGGFIVGGLVGDNWGDVIGCYATGQVGGTGRGVGGLVGGNYGSVTQSYSADSVSGSADVGGLVGITGIGARVTQSFWDTQTSGQAASAGGTGKTTAEMQRASTFLSADWDFVDESANGMEDIWWILEGKDYPRLWWESTNTSPPPPPAEGDVIELTEETFDQIVLGSDIPVLVDFWAPWCQPCLIMAPVIEEIADEYAGRIKVCKLNTDTSPNINRRYNITAIPTFILFQDGRIRQKWVGVTPKEDLIAGIDALL